MEWTGTTVGRIAAYPVLCARVVEYLGVVGLVSLTSGDAKAAAEAAAACASIVEAQPGILRPISDNAASSIAACVCLLFRGGYVEQVANLLRSVTRWVCDRYEEDGVGLAQPTASPKEELNQLLGDGLDLNGVAPRRESLLAVAVTELSYAFAPSLYADIVNDVLAAECIPTLLHPDDCRSSLCLRPDGEGTLLLSNVGYPDSGALAHHGLQIESRLIERELSLAVPIALACVLRDRLFVDVYVRLRSE